MISDSQALRQVVHPAFVGIFNYRRFIVLAQQSPDQPKASAATTSPDLSGMPTNLDLT